jgi:hypothetical protein
MRLSGTFSFQWFILAVVLILSGVGPQLLLLMGCCIYAAIEITAVRHLLQNPPLQLVERLGGTYLDKVQTQRDQYVAQAAMCEIMTGLALPLSGGGLIGMMVFWQFLKYRYLNDSMCKLAFSAIADAAGKLFYHPRCPAMIGTGFTKLKQLMHRMATGS